MRPWGTDDGDADAMATGRLDPDLYMRLYLFNISFACAARHCGRVESDWQANFIYKLQSVNERPP